MPLGEGEHIGQYTIVAQIGQGGMATVYKAYQARLARHVAVKVLHPTFLEDKNFLARFEREARIVARLDHPNIVPIYDYDEYEGRPYLVMKYVEGVTLKDRLAAGALAVSEILEVMTPVADALTYAHRQDVLHRDIKPSNILIDERGIPYLTDFGLARIVQAGESSLSADMLLGTPHYISPEQARGERNLDGRADVYSLGVILYELTVGRVPYSGDTPYVIVHHHIYTPPPRPAQVNPNITPQVEAVLLKALAKDPAARYQTPSELMAAFREAVEVSGMVEFRADPAAAAKHPPDGATELELKPAVYLKLERGDNRRVVVERRIDAGEVKLGDLGQRIESGIRQGVGFFANLAAQIQEQIEREKRPLTEEELIRRRIEKRDRSRRGIFVGLIWFLIFNLTLWAVWANMPLAFWPALSARINEPQIAQIVASIGKFPWPLIFTIPWVIGIIGGIIGHIFNHEWGVERREREIRREIERRRGRSASAPYEDEKAKRKREDVEREVRLTEDGELTDSYAQEWYAEERRKRR